MKTNNHIKAIKELVNLTLDQEVMKAIKAKTLEKMKCILPFASLLISLPKPKRSSRNIKSIFN